VNGLYPEPVQSFPKKYGTAPIAIEFSNIFTLLYEYDQAAVPSMKNDAKTCTRFTERTKNVNTISKTSIGKSKSVICGEKHPIGLNYTIVWQVSSFVFLEYIIK
jgi:hypothetical protein